MKKRIPNVCVYCGSRQGARPTYMAAAAETGRLIAQSRFGLVYGAGDLGLMGETARAAIAAGGKVTGIIPRHLLDLEVGKEDLETLIVTDTMHERKKLMFSNAEAVLTLPGGTGTLDELIEVVTWRQLGLHAKPVVLLDTDGYWQPLVALLRHMEEEGFVPATVRRSLLLAPDPEAAMATVRDALTPPG